MAKVADVFRRKRHYLPTMMLTKTDTKFGNISPAFNNSYDVFINLSESSAECLRFINQHGFFDKSNNSNPGDYLRLFCSEALLPGTQLSTEENIGQRQGIVTPIASLRRFPDVSLTFYAQRDYYTQDVFNAWVEYISPIRMSNGRHEGNTEMRRRFPQSYRRMKYPKSYKATIEITAFDNEVFAHGQRLKSQNEYSLPQVTNSITYYLDGAFPVSVVASPLAYGNAELIKTTVTFKYENYFIDRTSRGANGHLDRSDTGNNVRNPGIINRNTPGFQKESFVAMDESLNMPWGDYSGAFTNDSDINLNFPSDMRFYTGSDNLGDNSVRGRFYNDNQGVINGIPVPKA